MEMLIVAGIAGLLGACVLSSTTQRPPQQKVIYVRNEPTEQALPRENGLSLLLLCLVVVAALWLL